MSRLPDVSGTELVKALRKAGFSVLRQKGSHVSMKGKTRPAIGARLCPCITSSPAERCTTS